MTLPLFDGKTCLVILNGYSSEDPSTQSPAPRHRLARPRGGPGRRVPARHAIAGGELRGRLAPGSRRAQAQALVRIARLLGSDDPRAVAWWKLTPEVVDAIRAQLVDHGAPATANRVLSALRGALRAAWRAGLMDAAAYRGRRRRRPIASARRRPP